MRDKPFKDSTLVSLRATRVVDGVPTYEFPPPPPRWRAYFAAWDDVTNSCTVAPPTTNEEICAQPIFHKRHLPGLAPSWRPHGDTQPGKWIIAGVHRLDEVWNGDKNYWFKLSQIKSRVAANVDNYERGDADGPLSQSLSLTRYHQSSHKYSPLSHYSAE